MHHILSVDQFTKPVLEEFVDLAVHLQTCPNFYQNQAHGKILTNLFYEPSSRTYASFHSAMLRLGGGVIPIQEAEVFSSAVKGETLEDTIRTMGCYCDVIVLRHKENGAALRASEVAEVSIINAGDGTNEHPTQALLDFYTILMERGWQRGMSVEDHLAGLTVTMIGDLKHGRTVKSLSKLLRNYDVHINWVSPEEMRVPLQFFRPGDCEEDDLNTVIHKTDVLYVVRAQKERHDQEQQVTYGVTSDHMSRARSNMVLMHPLPRTSELPIELDSDPRSAYFRQMRYGLYMRMVILETVLL